MDNLIQRHAIVTKTLQALAERIQTIEQKNFDDYEMACESLIQRFEYTVDTFWKFIKLYLENVQKITLDIASPRGILRAATEALIISPEELSKLMIAITDRNLTSHTYNEDLATQIVARIPEHYLVIKKIFDRMKIM